MNPFISIIIPVYNTGRYLNRCMASVLNQDYDHYQVILIDDGSEDNSGAICDDFAKKYLSVKVVHQKNSGLSAARNRGVRDSVGEFVLFLDSDDYLEKDVLSFTVSLACRYDASIVSFKNRRISNDDFKLYNEYSYSGSVRELSAKEFLVSINQRTIGSSACTKLFKRKIFDVVQFTENVYNEDYLFLSELLIKYPDFMIVDTDYIGYNYYTRAGSISHAGVGRSTVDAVHNAMKMRELADDKDPSLLPVISTYAVYQAKTAILLHKNLPKTGDSPFVDECFEIIKTYRKYIRNSFFNFKDKVLCYLYLYCPRFLLRSVNYFINRLILHK